MRRFSVRRLYIFGSVARGEGKKGSDFENFRSDTKTVDAVVRNFEVIGEAVRI
jgi:predicted nucleotidyltransferase